MNESTLFDRLLALSARPAPFSCYTTAALWNDPHVSERMLAAHLGESINRASHTGPQVDQTVEWLISTFELGPGSRVLDLGCGPGLYTLPLAATGAIVTGLDFSERSIAYARGAAETSACQVDYMLGNYLEVPVDGRWELIIMIMRDFCALSPDQRRTLLDRVKVWLADGGRFVFDVDSLSAFENVSETSQFGENLMNGFWAKDPYFGFLHRFKYPTDTVSVDKYDIVSPAQTNTIYNWVQYFTVDQISTELAAAGLDQIEIFGDMTGTEFDSDSPEFAIVASVND